MQIRQLEYFVAVSEHLNFTKAAEKLFLSFLESPNPCSDGPD